jgi:hypothetical protein
MPVDAAAYGDEIGFLLNIVARRALWIRKDANNHRDGEREYQRCGLLHTLILRPCGFLQRFLAEIAVSVG